MYYTGQMVAILSLALLGVMVFGPTVEEDAVQPQKSAPLMETAVAEGPLAEISANGARLTLSDQIPGAQLQLRKLFNLENESEAPTVHMREFILSTRVPEIVDQFKPGQMLRVRYRIGSEPCVAVGVEACPQLERLTDNILSVQSEAAKPERYAESRLVREIRWNLNEDTRLSVQTKLIQVFHDRRGVVLEGVVPNELEKMMVEEKALRLAGGSEVLSRLRVENRL